MANLTEEQLQALATQVRSNPDMLSQLQGQQQPRTTGQVLQGAGAGDQVTQSTLGKGIAQSIKEGDPRFQREETAASKAMALAAPFIDKGSRVKSVSVGPKGETVTFEPSGKEQLQERIGEKKEEAQIQVGKEVEAQKSKDILRVEQDKVRAELSQDIMKNVWLDMLDQANRQSGWRPGVGLGVYATATGKMKWNDFYEGFEGTSNEYAARIARIAMPQTRAVRAIYLFKEGRPDQFSTIESGTNNLRRSYETIISGDMATNPESYIPGFTGKPEELAQLKNTLSDFGDSYEEAMYRHTFARNPNLLKPETVSKYGLMEDSEWEAVE